MKIAQASVSKRSNSLIEQYSAEPKNFSDLPLWKCLKKDLSSYDETGFPVRGRAMWAHVLCNESQTVFRLDVKLSAMFEGLSGILVHDRWGSCFLTPDIVHVLRDTHIIRDLLAIKTVDREPWAWRTRGLLLQASLATWLAHKKGKELSPRFLAIIELVYVRNLEEAEDLYAKQLAFGPARDGKPCREKKRPGHNLALGFPRGR